MSITAILLFVLFLGGRGLIGWDWTNYYSDFANAVPLNRFAGHKWYFKEPGWNLYVSFVKTITDFIHLGEHSAYNCFIFISTLIDGILIYLFLSRYVGHKHFIFAFAVFFVFYGFTFETDLMRNAKALLIFLVSVRYIESREWFKHFLLAVIACTFHWSLVVLLPCYFFIHKRIPIAVVITLFVIGNVIYLFGLPSVSLVILQIARFMPEDIGELVIGYVNNAVYNRVYGFSLGYIERTLVFILVLFYQHKIVADNKNMQIFINAMSLFVLICLYCYEFEIFITRFGALFSFGCWVMYPTLLKYLDKVSAPVFAILVSAVILIKMNNLSNNVLYDYQNFLIQDVDSYKHRKKIFDQHNKQLQEKK